MGLMRAVDDAHVSCRGCVSSDLLAHNDMPKEIMASVGEEVVKRMMEIEHEGRAKPNLQSSKWFNKYIESIVLVDNTCSNIGQTLYYF